LTTASKIYIQSLLSDAMQLTDMLEMHQQQYVTNQQAITWFVCNNKFNWNTHLSNCVTSRMF